MNNFGLLRIDIAQLAAQFKDSLLRASVRSRMGSDARASVAGALWTIRTSWTPTQPEEFALTSVRPHSILRTSVLSFDPTLSQREASCPDTSRASPSLEQCCSCCSRQ